MGGHSGCFWLFTRHTVTVITGDGSTMESRSGEMACMTGSWPKQLSHRHVPGTWFWIPPGSLRPPMWLGSQGHGGQGENRLVVGKPLASYWPEMTTWPSSAPLCDGGLRKSGLYFTAASKEKCSPVGRLGEVQIFIGDTNLISLEAAAINIIPANKFKTSFPKSMP